MKNKIVEEKLGELRRLSIKEAALMSKGIEGVDSAYLGQVFTVHEMVAIIEALGEDGKISRRLGQEIDKRLLKVKRSIGAAQREQAEAA